VFNRKTCSVFGKKQRYILIPQENQEFISAVIKEEHKQYLTRDKKYTLISMAREAVSQPLVILNKYWIFEKLLEKSNAVSYYIL